MCVKVSNSFLFLWLLFEKKTICQISMKPGICYHQSNLNLSYLHAQTNIGIYGHIYAGCF